jgi:hypothetical protein
LISIGLLFNQTIGVSYAQRTFFDVVLMLLIVLSLLFAAYRNVHDRITGETSVTVSPHLVSILSDEERSAVFTAFYNSLKAKGESIEVDYRFMADRLGVAFTEIQQKFWSTADEMKALEMATNGDFVIPGKLIDTTTVAMPASIASLSVLSATGPVETRDTIGGSYPERPINAAFSSLGRTGVSGFGQSINGNAIGQIGESTMNPDPEFVEGPSVHNRSGQFALNPNASFQSKISLNFSLKKNGNNAAPKPSSDSGGMSF